MKAKLIKLHYKIFQQLLALKKRAEERYRASNGEDGKNLFTMLILYSLDSGPDLIKRLISRCGLLYLLWLSFL